MTATPSSAPPLAKYLASTDKKTRDKAIKNLSVFLSNSSDNGLPKSEMDKLWKGVFYCFWMSDKPLVQQALASELAELVLTIQTTSLSLAFLRGFWETTVREWNGIDRLRIDKYYMLVRRFVNASFRLLARAEWDESACNEYNEILTREGGPLCSTDIRVPTSLAYHLADIYLEEFDKALGTLSSSSLRPPAPLATIMSPFYSLAAHTANTLTYNRIQSAVFEPLFAAFPTSSLGDREHSSKRARLDDQAFANLLQASTSDQDLSGLKTALLKKLFDVASDSETRDSSRKKMYALWKSQAEDEEDS
ncbi:hypothetical protein HGRIS_008255 [Hohenbuehelia grisea]|uniref:Nop52-domain-containing protein n=1 Tax=Hohenbuehelia grisea TaxID=104357 RepID=A0ABR3J7F2_9AGAR